MSSMVTNLFILTDSSFTGSFWVVFTSFHIASNMSPFTRIEKSVKKHTDSLLLTLELPTPLPAYLREKVKETRRVQLACLCLNI